MLTAFELTAAVCLALLGAGLVTRSRLAGRPVRAVPRAPVLPSGTALSGGGVPGWRDLRPLLLRPDRRLVALASGLMLTDVLVGLAAPWPLLIVVDYGLTRRQFPSWLASLNGTPTSQLVLGAAAAGLFLLACGAVAGYLVTFLMGTVNERMAARLRLSVTGHLLRAAPQRLARYQLGDLSMTVSDDAARIADVAAELTETLLPDLAMLAGMITITAFLDWRLTVVVLGIIPLYALTARRRNGSVHRAQRVARARDRDLAALTADLLGRIPAVQLFDRGQDETGRYAAASGAAASASVAALDAGARFTPVTDVLPGLGLAVALIVGSAEVASGRLTIGGLLVLLAYLASLTAPIRSLARLSSTVARGRSSLHRVLDLLALPALEPPDRERRRGGTRRAAVPRASSPARPELLRSGPAVRMTGVCYASSRGQQVLAGLNLRAERGEVICVTGPSGAGKSTMLSLLVRLAEPQAGRIMIGGADIRELPLRTLRKLVTLVPQDPWLRAGTIAENIADGLPGATHAQIIRAASLAGVNSFAEDLPSGYGTQVGEHGRQLSGGQQRRIAVARALLRDTPVLLLDEPTAGLDPVAEAGLITSLAQAAAGKTVILVSHHGPLAKLADRIVTLSQLQARPAGAPRQLQEAAA